MGIDGPDAQRMFAMVLRRPDEPLHGEWRDMPALGRGWGERQLRSVANLTRQDGDAFFQRAASQRIRTRSTMFRLDQGNAALAALRAGAVVRASLRISDVCRHCRHQANVIEETF